MITPTPALTRRQRTAPPSDRRTPRHAGTAGQAGGGYEYAQPETLAVGLESELARYPGTVFDAKVLRDRWSWFHRPRYIPPADNWVNWTAAGPTRPELHQRNYTLRMMNGNTTSRFPYLASSPTGGMHTMGPAGTARTLSRYTATPQMTAARVMRLRPGQYAGQTFSQTTSVQGR